jgi:hypothetical protein
MNENEIIKEYEEDFFKKTGKRIQITYNESIYIEDIKKYISNMVCKYNIFISSESKHKGRTIGTTDEQSNKIHLLRWDLSRRFKLNNSQIGKLLNCDRQSVRSSLVKVNSYIQTNDEKFMQVYNLIFPKNTLSL